MTSTTTTALTASLAASASAPAEVVELDEAIDTLVEVESAIRKLTAFRTVLLDAARRQVPAAEAALLRPASGAARSPLRGHEAELAERAFVADVATALLLPEVTARALVEEARSLVHELPATLAALGSGAISYRHAQVLVEDTTDLDQEARTAVEAAVLPRAATTTASGLRRHARRVRERVHPEPATTRHAKASAGRRVCLDPAADGMTWLSAFLPAAVGHAVMDRIDHAAATLAGSDEPRTRDQLRADVLSALLLDGGHLDDARLGGADGDSDRRATASLAHGIVPRVAVTVPVLTLLGGSQPAELEGYGPIDPDTARELAAAAPSFTRLLTDPHTGAVLAVGRTSYAVPADLRRHLAVRDATCRFPGCGRRASACDVDHLTAFADGGSTDAPNLVHLCRHHHRLKHETSWRVAPVEKPGAPPGTVRWTSPTGRIHTTLPAESVVAGSVGAGSVGAESVSARTTGAGQPPRRLPNEGARAPGPDTFAIDPPF